MDVVSLFDKGGYVMYLLLISSIAVAAIGIERFRFYGYAKHDSDSFLDQLSTRLKARDMDATLALCRQQNSSLSLVARSGVEAMIGGDDAELAMLSVHDEEAMKLRARLNYLSMIVTLAPLLGLLGTISGMIESFNIFALQAGQPLAITGGIGEALIATATGLCVAIFALIVHTYFAQKLDEILALLEKTMNVVLMAASKRAE